MYVVTLADGTTITNLSKNGDMYISKSEIKPSIFDYNCSPVIINNGEYDDTHEHMALITLYEELNEAEEPEYWFALRDVTEEELQKIKMQSDIEYLAMMTGIEL